MPLVISNLISPLFQKKATSEWTLDYPPLFAWFEYVMSFAAAVFDPEMLVVENITFASPNTIIFQRISVIVSELALVLAAYR